MRFYTIRLFDPSTNQAVREWTSHPNGKYDPHALDIEFDMPVGLGHLPKGGVTVTIYGVALQDLVQARDFSGLKILLYGGMATGLPLANPKQQGLLLAGTIFQAFGNWQGTEMTLDFVVVSTKYTYQSPGNIVLNWRAGTPLSQALAQTFAVAYPGIPVSIHISPNLVQNHDEPAFFSTFQQLATWVEQITRIRFNNPVYMTPLGVSISVFDASYQPTPVQVAFTDFVGQPTWIRAQTLQIKTVLRGDIPMGGLLTLPKGLQDAPGIALTSAAAFPSQLRYKSTFKGIWRVNEARHIGHFRNPDGASWVSLFNCVPNTLPR